MNAGDANVLEGRGTPLGIGTAVLVGTNDIITAIVLYVDD